jgi:3-deoxy-7-phosphoheptulonate synthase
MQTTQDLNVVDTLSLIPPAQLKSEQMISPTAIQTILSGRQAVQNILSGQDERMIVVVGPCSLHDQAAGLEYARRLTELASQVSERLLLVMRVYFEKPRTTVGWKGLINDPHLNDTFDITAGLRIARSFLLEVANMGLPSATEMLEPITPQYIADLITVSSVGARTTESPTHRQMASGLSMPVGYKNGTDGGLQVAINAIASSSRPHRFLGIDQDGQTCIVVTSGNPCGYLILRGGRSGPNFHAEHLREASERLADAALPVGVVVDCSHANSNKDYSQQGNVWQHVLEQRLAGNRSIVGLMLESNLNPGRQELSPNLSQLKFGVSITDGCIGWDETQELILAADAQLSGA